LIAGQDGAPFVVGDDDQSIYRWRGARVENLTRFSKDFPAAKLYRLEQNYRSTGNILKAANTLIANNTGRLGKNLWTQGADGERIRLYAAFNERDEAEFVMNRIREWSNQGGARRDVAILYRSNAQSRVFEEIFMGARIPYKVYGGLRFFERAEIKDALAYLRIITNHSDDASFERVVNLPTRGIGAKSLDVVRDQAKLISTSLWQAAELCIAQGLLGPKAETAVGGFLKLVEQLGRDIDGLALHEQVDHVINNSGLVELHKKEKADRGEARVENLNELVSAARGFEPDGLGTDDEQLPPLEAFLAHAVLESGEGQAEAWEDCVQMMTLHTAKGLEFPVVFMSGLEDGLFPHQRSLNDPEGLEEERRLCYVGATRAMKQLYLTYAEQRRLHGMDSFGTPSRFISEIPDELIEEVRPRIQISRPVAAGRFRAPVEELAPGVRLGARVRHKKFGEGVILKVEGQGPQANIQVNFASLGVKIMMLEYLEVVR
jgi:DNA helicase-2/ATP-dependent DNA helicase PcrA